MRLKQKSTKTKNCIINYARYMHHAKKSFHMVYVGTCDCYGNIKIKTLIYNQHIKAMTLQKFLTAKRKRLYSLTTFCELLHPCCYWGTKLYITFPCCVMSRLHIGKTSLEQDQIKDTHDPRSQCNQRKSKCSERQQRWRAWGHSEPLSRGFGGRRLLRKSLGSKEHLDWLQIDLNVG